jgi:hypothetical protein
MRKVPLLIRCGTGSGEEVSDGKNDDQRKVDIFYFKRGGTENEKILLQ